MTSQRCRSYLSTLLLLSVAATLLSTVAAFTPLLSTSTTAQRATTYSQQYQKQDTALYGWIDKLKKTAKEATFSDLKGWYPDQQSPTYEMSEVKVEGDHYDARLVRPLLKDTVLESRPLEVAYNAQWDGWSPSEFHKKVDNKGPAVVIAKTSNGHWVGCYQPKGWTSKGVPRTSIATFLFYQKKQIGDWQKLRVLNGGFMSCKDEPNTGIYIGVDSFVVPLERNNDVDGKAKGNVVLNGKQAYSKLGIYFENGPDKLTSLFGKDNTTNLTELKVLVGVYENDEKIPNSD